MARKKKQYTNEPCLVTSIQTKMGREGNTLYDVRLKGLSTDCEYQTWLDTGFVNYRKWRAVVDTFRVNHPHKGVVIDNLYFKDPDTNLIDADSQYAITSVAPISHIERAVRELRGEVNKFEDMFYRPRED